MQRKSSPLSAYNYNVVSIAEDSSGNLWLATSQGLIYFDRGKNKAIRYAQAPNNPKSLSYNNVEKVFIDSKKNVWVSTKRGLNLFQPETETFLHVSAEMDKHADLSNIYFMDIVEDKEGNLWFGTYGDGLFRFNTKKKSHSWINYRHHPQDNGSLSADRVQKLFIDRQGNLWIGVENGGLNLFDRKTEKFRHYRANEHDPNSLNNESIYAIYEDEIGKFWIGTFAGGINISKFNSDAIMEYTNFPGVPTSLSNNSVTCFMEDHRGRIWIGTDGGGLNLFDSETGRFIQFNSKNTNLNSDALLSIVEDSDHQIWLGTWGGGLIRFDLKTRSFQSFTTNNSAIPDNNIFSIIEDKKGDLWLGSFQNGLIQYEKKKNRFNSYTSENSGLSMNMITVVREIPDGRLLVGTPSGLNIFYPDKKYFKTYFYVPGDAHSLSSNGIHFIIVENDTTIWIGTHNGLNRFNPRTEMFAWFSKKDGLPDNVIKGLALDATGKLWVSTNKGICRWDIKDRTHKNFVKADGLQSNEFNDRSALRLKDGRILMGGIRGFNVLYTEKIKENRNIPRILITDFLVFNIPMGAGVAGSPLKTHISETDLLTLSYKQSVITFQFAAMDFTAPEKNQYAYKMEGFENDWNFVGTQRMATYTNLSPGEYTFRVKGSNNDGVWNEEGTAIRITITPPFWQTAWFRVVGIILVFSVLVTGYKIRTARIRAHNRELGHRVSERTAQLEAANKELEAFAYSVSHDLRAPLRAIDGYTKILVEDYKPSLDEEGKRMCAVICNETKRMGQLIDDLLSFSHISHTEMQVSPINMEAMVYSVFNELTTPESRERIDFRVAPLPSAIGDLTLMHQLWMNLLSNAIKFSSKRERAVIEVGYQQDGQRNIYSVRDNGAGFDMQYADKLFTVFWRLHNDKEFEGTGVGLAIVQRLIHRHGGEVWAESQVDKGAIFYFTVPWKGEALWTSRTS
jgi:ligand-binding sensor domain-containing protein/signal transduction histidine kinase